MSRSRRSRPSRRSPSHGRALEGGEVALAPVGRDDNVVLGDSDDRSPGQPVADLAQLKDGQAGMAVPGRGRCQLVPIRGRVTVPSVTTTSPPARPAAASNDATDAQIVGQPWIVLVPNKITELVPAA